MVPREADALIRHPWLRKFQFFAALRLFYTNFPLSFLHELWDHDLPWTTPHPLLLIGLSLRLWSKEHHFVFHAHVRWWTSETVKQEMWCSAAAKYLQTLMLIERWISAAWRWSLGSLPSVDLWWKYINVQACKTWFFIFIFLQPSKTG